jgi:hypothetical protein
MGAGLLLSSAATDARSDVSAETSHERESGDATRRRPPRVQRPRRTGRSTAWVDGAGNFWLFGGESLANPLAGGEPNDLWEYRHAD